MKVALKTLPLAILLCYGCSKPTERADVVDAQECLAFLTANGYSAQTEWSREMIEDGMIIAMHRMSESDILLDNFCVGFRDRESARCVFFLPITPHVGGDFGYCVSQDYGARPDL